MKQGTSLMKRCVAMALAVVMIISYANLGLVQQALAADKTSVSIAEIVANNYDLSEAEKELLKSGYLVSDSFEYTVPSAEDELVSVDTENAKITAQDKNGWVPTGAVIVYGGNELEVALTDGVGTYDPAVVGNAFSVKVTYELSKEVEISEQEALLAAAAILKQGVKNTDDVAAQSGNLFILETAMPELVDLAENGYQTSFASAYMSDEFVAAVKALNDQMTANGGTLTLSNMITDYEASTKTGYMMTKGVEMQAEVAFVVSNVSVLATDLTKLANNMDFMVENGWVSQDLANQIKNLAGVVSNLNDGLANVNNDPWTAANSTDLLVAEVDYAKLDALVAALGESTAVSVKNTLHVASTTIQANLSMWNVTVKVVLKKVVDNEIVAYATESVVLTLGDGATAEEVKAAVAESGIEAAAIAAWGDAYVAGKYEMTATELPAALDSDLEYVITYAPKYFTVTIAGEAASYPYGYKLTLPVHADPSKSYDYKDANGTYYAQGTVVTVEDDMTFTREEGKSYTQGQLLAIIADNYGTAKVTAILTSGALKVDEVISYREPSKAELEELVKLEGSTLTVQSYASSYAGLYWEPYSYVVDGTEKLFNGASQIVIDGDFTTVNVFYRLTLSNHTKTDVKEILDLVATLNDEAEGQKSVMDKLAGYEGQMSQLTKNMLTGLSAVIGNYTTANGGGLNPDPVKNDELVAYFQQTISDIVNNCTEGQSLKLYNIILAYNDENNGGLTYYYRNDAAIRAEIEVLSGYLNDMLDGGDRQAALEKLMAENGYSDKVDVLETLGTKLAEISAELKPVNSAINTSDPAKLSALASALASEGSVEVTEYDSPYIQMGPVVRTAEKYVTVEVKVVAGGKTNTFQVTIGKGEALTQAQVNELKAQVTAFAETAVEVEFYTNDYNNGAALDALVGVALTQGETLTFTWTPKDYIVKISGEADQVININNLTVTLPAHPYAASGMSYEYTIGSKTATAGIYTFTKDELRTLFVDGVYTITRVEKNANVEQLVKMVAVINADMGFEALTLVEENGVYTGINANIAMGDLMDLVMGLVMKSGYGYIGLNDEAFIYSNDKAELELSMQTLINAILNDDDFSHETIIALGENGKGELLTASMQLGASAGELQYTNLTFTMNLTSVPQQMVSATGYIKTIAKYITFHSDNGVMAVEVNLPDQVYAAYAAALVATGNVDKTDVNDLTQKVPMQFLYDYLTAITGSEMDLETFTNTIEMLGINRDLTSYNKYYTNGLDAYNQYIDVTISEDMTLVSMATPGQKSVDALLKLAGIDKSSLANYLGMIKEYKEGGMIELDVSGTLLNVNKTYYALIIDAQADGLRNKVAAPTSYQALAAETAGLAGYSVVILLNDVEGNLTFDGTTVLDLNGHNVNGTIDSVGTLYIIDSTRDTYSAGTVNAVTGNAVILAGNYNTDVSSKLKDGYYMDGTTVRNALYYIIETAPMAGADVKNVTYVLNGDVYSDENVSGYLPNAKALAIDIATDLLLNYLSTAKLSVGGNELIGIDVDDLVGLYAGDDRVNKLAKNLIDCINIGEAGFENNVGFEAVVNMILADLIDFGAISDALANGTPVATYEITTEPWLIEIDHNTDGNYATINVGSNPALAKTINLSLIVESKYNDTLSALTGELAEIVVADETEIVIDFPAPTYSDKELTIYGAAKANAVVDMSKNSDYVTMIGVILAYGNSGKRDAVAAALNAGDMDAMKTIIDGTSVKEVFTALKAMSRNVSFASMANTVGVTKNVASAAELEAVYHTVLCASGKVLEELEITGMNSKLGALYNAETGYYELEKEDIFRDVELSAYGYSAVVEAEVAELCLKVKLFGNEDECLWGDANHDGEVNAMDATLVLKYSVGMLKDTDFFCDIRTDVNGDGEINAMDATLILKHSVGTITLFPVEE